MADVKARLRQRLRAARRAIVGSAREAAHRSMAAHLLCTLESVPGNGVVGLYAGQADEADPREFLEVLPPMRIAWPRVVGAELELAECDEIDLVPGFRGILEPPPFEPALALSQLRLLVVPGLAFDRRGHRLGQGGGHYDRLLERLRGGPHPGLVVGLAYHAQIVPEVPHEAHDQPVDLVLTEEGILGEP